MRFTEEFRRTRRPDWRFHYFDYSAMKAFLKDRAHEKTAFTEADEEEFIKLVDGEIAKSQDFMNVKLGELTRHTQYIERVKIQSIDWAQIPEREKLRAEVDELTADLVDVSLFEDMNRRAVARIVKKHDKSTSFFLAAMYRIRLGPEPQVVGSPHIDTLISRLSSVYQTIRNAGKSEQQQEQAAQAAQSFTRTTTKYWVVLGAVTQVKAVLLKHLPVFVFGKKEEHHDPQINSVYLDNDDHSVYHARLDKLQGAQAIRLRWYGSGWPPKEVFVERKTHQEGWTGESSVKERFALKEKQVADFLTGRLDMAVVAERMRKHGSSEESVETMLRLASEIQEIVASKKLEPSVRTTYNRMAFQRPGTAKVRVSLDTELCMLLERGRGSGNGWCRQDEHHEIPNAEIVRFPHAVLEVKLQLVEGEIEPSWISQLVNTGPLEDVPKFSKFVHGASVLFSSEVVRVPYWLPQIGVLDEDRAMTAGPTTASAAPMVPSPSRRKSVSPSEESKTGERQPLLPRSQHRSREPQIAVPVRVEPKVFFANERTFLSWLHFSIFLGSAASALLGLGGPTARVSGISIVVAAVLVALYALVRYEYRAVQIRHRNPGPYDDRVGPVLVVVVFVVVMTISVVFSVI